MVVNTLLIVIAVLTRHSISAGVLAIAMTEAAQMNMSLAMLIVEWTSEPKNALSYRIANKMQRSR